MPVLFRDTVTRQPQYLADIEWGNPITRGMCLALLPGSTKNLTKLGADAAFAGISNPTTKVVADNTLTKGAVAWTSLQDGCLTWAPPTGVTEATLLQVQVNSGSAPHAPWYTSSGDFDFITWSDNTCYFGAFGATRYISGAAVPGGVSSLSTPYVLLARGASIANSHAVYKNGALIGSGNPTFNIASTLFFGRASSGYIYGVTSGILLDLFWRRALTTAEVVSVSNNPWQVFRAPARKLWLMGEASGTHTTTGDVAGGGATVAGTATHKTLHTTTGVATGGGATVAGAATHKIPHTTTGAVAGAGATVAGTATHKTLHTTTGAVTGGGATVAGAATHPHTTTGAVTGGGAAVAGASDHTTPGGTHTTTGDAAGAGATVTGAATHLTLHTTSGATEGGGAAVAGASGHLTLHETSGAVQGGGGATTGAAELISLNGGKSSYLRQWLMEYYEAEWAQKAPVLADPPAVAPTPVAQAARTITRRTVRAAVAEQKKPPPAPYRADPRAAVNDFIQKQTAAVARKARVAAAIDSQDLAALTRRQQQRSAEAEEAEDEEILLLAAVL